MPEILSCDVAILGGGPAGSTCGTLLKKYAPDLRVVVLEKERFPREHVGESQLPSIGFILKEMGVWDKVEAADFPIKVGATYRWGSSPDLWDFEFLPLSQVPNTPRPHGYEQARRLTAFQVDRAVYDDILLRHAEESGCEVHQETKVADVERDGDRTTGLVLADGRRVEARYYVDATGHHGLLRRAMDVPVDVPTRLKNVAIWDYWENTEWATTVGSGGTRVQVLSIGTGWIWFIPIAPTRTSIGFICPADYYKECGKTKEDLYAEALQQEPRVRALTANASREGQVRATKDWSFLAERLHGENWFLIGESAGFADPILSGGLTLAHDSARHCAYVILELDRDEHPRDWLLYYYQHNQRAQILNFIRFADFWYASNGQFTELEEYSKEIAANAGLKLSPKAAFRWLSLGGFNVAEIGRPGVGGLDLGAIKEVTRIFFDNARVSWEINRYNQYRLDLAEAEKDTFPVMTNGRIHRLPCWRRDGKTLPYGGVHACIIDAIRHSGNIKDILEFLRVRIRQGAGFHVHDALATLETMLMDGWVTGRMSAKRPRVRYAPPRGTDEWGFHPNRDEIAGLVVDGEDADSGDGRRRAGAHGET